MKKLFKWLNGTRIFRGLTPEEFSWVLYDVGNSAFTMLACSLIPIWFKDLAIGTGPGKLSGDQATAYYSLSISLITIVIALLLNATALLFIQLRAQDKKYPAA